MTPAPRGFTHFDGDVAFYDATKPTYPDYLITRIVDAMPGRDVLDVGCGTGIEARQFQAAGCSVLGVDPDARMAEFARGTGIHVETSTFESWEPAGRMFDAVTAGTAWHWVDPVAGVAKAAYVLRPGGLLAPLHHAQHTPAELADIIGDGLPAWTTRSAVAYQRMAPSSLLDASGGRRSSVSLYQVLFDEIANQIRHAGTFSEPEQLRFDWAQTFSRDEWLEVLPTFGAVAKLPPHELARVLERVGAQVDEMGGTFSLQFTTVAVVAVRRP